MNITSIIRIEEKEYTEDNLGVQSKKITFLGIPVYKKLGTTTNGNIVRQLAKIEISDKKEPKDNQLKAKMGFQVSN